MVKTLSLEDFKKQIDFGGNPPEQRLSETEINKIQPSVLIEKMKKQGEALLASAPKLPQKQTKAEFKKNLILAIKSDSYGCGWVRCTQWMTYLDSVFGRNHHLQPVISNGFILDETTLFKAKTIFLQRHMSPEHREIIRALKNNQQKYRYKLIHEMDDQILDYFHEGKELRGVPDYNSGQQGITKAVQQSYIDIMNMADLLTVSTDNIKKFLQKEVKIKTPIKVIENVVAKYMWNGGKIKKITKNITKPKIIVTSSPTHYSNQKRLYGDFSPGWVEYMVNGLKNNKIELTWIGPLPFFLEEVKDKVDNIEWVNSYDYPRTVLGVDADFCLFPLIPNQFNCSKSDLKNIECCAAGIIGIGADFTYRGYKSPYHYMKTKIRWDCTAKELENLINSYCSVEKYNRTIEENLNFLEENGRWLESPKFINDLVKTLTFSP